ncbi:pro-resilin-like [Artemia franciscana]|uniref:Cuticle protein n=1 Tax=Artemia franciscana TaxID=6661 RepID=A0AA88L2B6_ARTSF|nr:hypothetical protein QYM36_017297 [Artemia franciscana]
MKIIIFAAVLAIAIAEGPAYGPPHGPGLYAPAYKGHHYEPKPYDFAYAVRDDYTYNNFGHSESSDGKGYTKGQYFVNLPDGRLQTVTYTADIYGYKADVQYTGEAKHPEYKPAYKAGPFPPVPHK